MQPDPLTASIFQTSSQLAKLFPDTDINTHLIKFIRELYINMSKYTKSCFHSQIYNKISQKLKMKQLCNKIITFNRVIYMAYKGCIYAYLRHLLA